jgi:hypothetical protein
MAAIRFSRIAAKRVSESPISHAAPGRQALAGRDLGAGTVGSRNHRPSALIALYQDLSQPKPVSHTVIQTRVRQLSVDNVRAARRGRLHLADCMRKRGEPFSWRERPNGKRRSPCGRRGRHAFRDLLRAHVYKRLIIVLGTDRWAGCLAGQRLDDRIQGLARG